MHLNVWRDHAAHEIDVTLGRVGSEREASASASAGVGTEPGKLGLALRPLAKHERAQAQVYHGMVAQGAESAAARAGLQAGDVVLAINGRPLDNIEDLQQVLRRKPKSVALLVNPRAASARHAGKGAGGDHHLRGCRRTSCQTCLHPRFLS